MQTGLVLIEVHAPTVAREDRDVGHRQVEQTGRDGVSGFVDRRAPAHGVALLVVGHVALPADRLDEVRPVDPVEPVGECEREGVLTERADGRR